MTSLLVTRDRFLPLLALVLLAGGLLAACDTEAPPMPTRLEAASLDGAVRLTWGPGGVSDLREGYRLYRDTAPFEAVELTDERRVGGVLKRTTYVDSSVTNGTTYYYRVVSVGGGPDSSPSGLASATPLPAPSRP
jgi:mannan endo-1,4-beta-mannosidase